MTACEGARTARLESLNCYPCCDQVKFEAAIFLVCFGKVIVEIKAVSALTDEHRAQLMTTCAAPAAHQLQPLPGVEHERFVI